MRPLKRVFFDDDDDLSKPRRPPQESFSEVSDNIAPTSANEDKAELDDPLDEYMKGLDNELSGSQKASSSKACVVWLCSISPNRPIGSSSRP